MTSASNINIQLSSWMVTKPGLTCIIQKALVQDLSMVDDMYIGSAYTRGKHITLRFYVLTHTSPIVCISRSWFSTSRHQSLQSWSWKCNNTRYSLINPNYVFSYLGPQCTVQDSAAPWIGFATTYRRHYPSSVLHTVIWLSIWTHFTVHNLAIPPPYRPWPLSFKASTPLLYLPPHIQLRLEWPLSTTVSPRTVNHKKPHKVWRTVCTFNIPHSQWSFVRETTENGRFFAHYCSFSARNAA